MLTRTVNRSGLLFERLLGGPASAEIPVDQLDVAMRGYRCSRPPTPGRLPLRAVLRPRRLGAMIRHLRDPDADLEDREGIAGVIDAWAGPRWNERDHVWTRGTYRDWHHAVVSAPCDAWPAPVYECKPTGTSGGVRPIGVLVLASCRPTGGPGKVVWSKVLAPYGRVAHLLMLPIGRPTVGLR